MTSLEKLRSLDTSSPTLGFSNRRYQRLEKAVQSKLLERLNHQVPSENIIRSDNFKSDDSMRSVIQEVIQKHVELSGGDLTKNNNNNEKTTVKLKNRVLV